MLVVVEWEFRSATHTLIHIYDIHPSATRRYDPSKYSPLFFKLVGEMWDKPNKLFPWPNGVNTLHIVVRTGHLKLKCDLLCPWQPSSLVQSVSLKGKHCILVNHMIVKEEGGNTETIEGRQSKM